MGPSPAVAAGSGFQKEPAIAAGSGFSERTRNTAGSGFSETADRSERWGIPIIENGLIGIRQ